MGRVPGLTLAVALVAALPAAAAGQTSADEPAAPRARAKPAATGAIAGTVRFAGAPPARAAIERPHDPVCAKLELTSEDVVVADGKLRDVHVRLPTGAAGSHRAPAAPVVIDQRACMYHPRVVGVVGGQTVTVTNSDPTFHNVRGTAGDDTRFNLAQPAKAPPIVREALGAPGEVVVFRCDVHPWMRAFAVVTDHPFFAVTGDDGAFRIEGVPAGAYTLEAWHPTLGLQKVRVRVRGGRTAQASFMFGKD
jgi:plastocyanin